MPAATWQPLVHWHAQLQVDGSTPHGAPPGARRKRRGETARRCGDTAARVHLIKFGWATWACAAAAARPATAGWPGHGTRVTRRCNDELQSTATPPTRHVRVPGRAQPPATSRIDYNATQRPARAIHNHATHTDATAPVHAVCPASISVLCILARTYRYRYRQLSGPFT